MAFSATTMLHCSAINLEKSGSRSCPVETAEPTKRFRGSPAPRSVSVSTGDAGPGECRAQTVAAREVWRNVRRRMEPPLWFSVILPVSLVAQVVVVRQIGDNQPAHLQWIDGSLQFVDDFAIGAYEHGVRNGSVPIRIKCGEKGVQIR